MGLLVNGEWHDRWYETDKSERRFVRDAAAFRNWVTVEGSPGPTGTGGLQPAELLAPLADLTGYLKSGPFGSTPCPKQRESFTPELAAESLTLLAVG